MPAFGFELVSLLVDVVASSSLLDLRDLSSMRVRRVWMARSASWIARSSRVRAGLAFDVAFVGSEGGGVEADQRVVRDSSELEAEHT